MQKTTSIVRRESSVERSAVRICDTLGCLFIKLANSRRNGMPDRLLIAPNVQARPLIAFFEAKRKGGKISAKQKSMAEKLKKLGCPHFYFDSVDGFKDTLHNFLTGGT
jgi:hypothetical protein